MCTTATADTVSCFSNIHPAFFLKNRSPILSRTTKAGFQMMAHDYSNSNMAIPLSCACRKELHMKLFWPMRHKILQRCSCENFCGFSPHPPFFPIYTLKNQNIQELSWSCSNYPVTMEGRQKNCKRYQLW